MTLPEKLAYGQAQAPAYMLVAPDGAPYKCGDCGARVDSLVKTFTPDGVNHAPVCMDCVDADWLKAAKPLGVQL